MVKEVKHLNEQFGLMDHLSFKAGLGELVVAEIDNDYAAATVALQGGHVITFQPHGHRPVLWVSRQAHYQRGKAIRGGIPVAWPWFADHPTDPAKPAHGFARTALWSVLETAVVDQETTQLRLGLADTGQTRALWPHPFQLELVITVGLELRVTLVIRNPGEAPFTCGGALHSYFNISDVINIVVHGLEDTPYIDKLDQDRRKVQAGPVTIEGETDRIYLDSPATCTIEDPGWGRRIQIAKSGSRSTVVWNPWIDKARRLSDFGDEEYTGMVCVETTNAADDVVTVPPGGEHRLAAVIGLSQATN